MGALTRDSVAAVVTCHDELPAEGLLERLAAEVPRVTVVLDGMPPEPARALQGAADRIGADLLEMEPRAGKGHAIASAIRSLSARPSPEAVVFVDSDGQHPPEAIPEFLAAASTAELVIGDRFAGGGEVPVVRRAANRLASRLVGITSGISVPDSQCGMRLLRGRALSEVGFPGGRMESETRHLKRCLRAGVPVTWVPIPAIYDGAPSSFRPIRDSVAVLAAAVKAD